MRRRPSARVLGLLVGLSLATTAREASADQIAPSTATYSVTNTSTVPISLIDLAIQPPGSVVPPVTGTDPKTGQPITSNPFTVVTGSSKGFAQVDDSLGTITGKQQVLELTFGMQPVLDPKTGMPVIGTDNKPLLKAVLGPNGAAVGGLQPGGVLTFSLALGSSAQAPQLLPTPTSAELVKLQLLSNPQTPSTGGTKSIPSPNPISGSSPGGSPTITAVTPEPISLAIWALPAALGILRVRARRRNG